MKSQLSLPFAIAQIGKAFRNEVSPGKGIFRTKEFEQLEFEEFVVPENAYITLKRQENQISTFLTQVLGFSDSSFSFQDVTGEDLPHYSIKNSDLHYKFEFGTEELWGVANRGDFDLSAHQAHSGVKLHLQIQDNSKVIIPYVIEHSVGLNRLLLAVITEKLIQKEGRNWEILSLPIWLSPYKFAILPLTKKQEDTCIQFFDWLQKSSCSVILSKKGSIGKRYKEQDEIGTPYCLTVDFQSKDWEDSEFSFTLRERDSGNQIRLQREDLKNYILDCLGVNSVFR